MTTNGGGWFRVFALHGIVVVFSRATANKNLACAQCVYMLGLYAYAIDGLAEQSDGKQSIVSISYENLASFVPTAANCRAHHFFLSCARNARQIDRIIYSFSTRL